MKKIMFNDKYGLTQAVLEGRKTMTRRMANAWERQDGTLSGWMPGAYKVGEEVAVAQSYKSIHEEMMNGDYGNSRYDAFRCAMVAGTKGWNNKMFVRSDLMPYRIRITGIKVERLRDISSEDCLKEGIEARVTGCHTFYYIHGEDKAYNFPKQAFSALIDKVSGKGTCESNPWVFVYEFELLNS